MKNKIISIISIYGVLAASNAFSQNDGMSYPYISSTERKKFITENYEKIQINQTEQEVKEILGTPDDILSLYEPKIKKPKKIGFTFWYILQRLKSRRPECHGLARGYLQENGSQNERVEKIVRISFDLKGKVIAIDQWGLKIQTP